MSEPNAASAQTLVTMQVAEQPFGIWVESVRDVLGGQNISRVPLSPPAIAGSLNLRGRIVTVLDVRVLLGMQGTEQPEKAMNVVIEHQGELYSLLVDQVGDVLTVDHHKIEGVPQTVTPAWKSVSSGIVKLKDELVLILVTETLLQIAGLTTAEELAA
ncbi:MAG: chemotaxis protein CheW [Alphaproteobacteria bacterium]|nr:chemotaxis protein CheW [Alphaproteobacteria bacterium]